MSDFAATYQLSRGRFEETVLGLTASQLNYRIHADALTIGESALHVAGVEVSFYAQLTGAELSPELLKLRSAATDGSINDNPFPYAQEEITDELLRDCLAKSRALVEPLLDTTDEAILKKEIKSALGPTITGQGALVRIAYHPGYHQGQAYLIKTAPDYPR